MSCKDCDNNPLREAYYRWGIANVEIIACRKHWLEIREVLNEAQRIKREIEEKSSSREDLCNL